MSVPTIPGLEDVRARLEDVKATIYERLQTLPFAEKLPGIIFKPPVDCTTFATQATCEEAGCYWYTATGETTPVCHGEPQTAVMRVQNILKKRPRFLGQGGIRGQYTASQLPPFNFPGIASILLKPQRRTHPQRRGMHPGIVDTMTLPEVRRRTTRGAVEAEKGAYPVGPTHLSVEL